MADTQGRVEVTMRTGSYGRHELYGYCARLGSIELKHTYGCITAKQVNGSMAQFMEALQDHPDLKNKPVVLRLPFLCGMEWSNLEKLAKDAFKGDIIVTLPLV